MQCLVVEKTCQELSNLLVMSMLKQAQGIAQNAHPGFCSIFTAVQGDTILLSVGTAALIVLAVKLSLAKASEHKRLTHKKATHEKLDK